MKRNELDRALTAARQLASAVAEKKLPQPRALDPPADPGDAASPVAARTLPLDVVDEHAARIVAFLKRATGVKTVEVAGAARRRCEATNELVLIACAQQPGRVMRQFLSCPQALAAQPIDTSRARLFLPDGLHVDLRVVPPRSFGAMLHNLTGSAAHNDALRRHGLAGGVRVSDYGLFRLLAGQAGARRIGGQHEQDVFDAVGLPWIPPELREDGTEIDAAAAGSLPQLVTTRDIRGDLHVQTTAGLGSMSVQDALRACRNRGYEYCALTDQPTDPVPARRLARLEEQATRIADARRKLRLHVLHGLDTDIRADGALHATDDELAIVDFATVRIRSHLRMSRRRMTARIIRALEHPSVRILAHPVSRTAGAGDAVDFDFAAVAAAAATLGVALEIDARPVRGELQPPDIRRAREFGAATVIGTGARSVAELELMRYGVDRARRAWSEAHDVLNTWQWPALERWVHERR